MIPVKGYAAQNPKAPLAPFKFERRELKPHDVLIDIIYCGVCHSDIHMARDEWGGAIYPLVPGHEIVGKVNRIGSSVKKFKVGDLAAVGVLVDSCRECSSCKQGLEQYCEVHWVPTYSGYEMDNKTITYGGYSNQIVTDENYVLQVPNNLDRKGIAPLLCAGITTYSPLRHWRVGKGHKIGVVGLGGLGHMAVKFAASFDAEVTVLSTSNSKQADAKRLGAAHFINTTDEAQLKKAKGQFDFLLNTIAAHHDINSLVALLKLNGTMIMVGIPPEDPSLSVSGLIGKRRTIAGSMIGGIRETQEMLNYCAEKNIVSDVEVIAMKDINMAYERMIKGDVRYRFVIDMATL
ncbi:MAG: NAD(P)-dependent alcohol dehydrogenase [Bacteroidetes bacterium]|nr:NAD(P)-dependent alcohol dehydrogenase [Bacteroidota bacterium]